MQGVYGGLIIVLLYAGASAIPPSEGFFLQTDHKDFLLTDFTNLLLA